MNHLSRAREQQAIVAGWVEVILRTLCVLAALTVVLFFALTGDDPTSVWLGVIGVLLGAQELTRQAGVMLRGRDRTDRDAAASDARRGADDGVASLDAVPDPGRGDARRDRVDRPAIA